MPAQNLQRENKEGIYLHVFNKGIEGRAIFRDEADFRVFLGFVEEYLSAPKDLESTKKEFSVNGRTFRGVPHQPKNYLGKVELIAYSLQQDHFHLVLHQKTPNSLQAFIRSLCTRYSMYFNKKYKHSGAVFEGPYKSIQIKDETDLLYLTRYLHLEGNSSSYQLYLSSDSTPWVQTEIVQSHFDKIKGDSLKGTDSYKDFVVKHKPNKEIEAILKDLTFEAKSPSLERSDPAREKENVSREYILASDGEILDFKLKPHQRIPEFLTVIAIFLLLFTFSMRNIILASANGSRTSTLGANTHALPTKTPTPTAAPEVTPQPTQAPKMVTVKIPGGDKIAIVNIRQEPVATSQKIGKAKDGDTFEFVSKDLFWYEVKLADGTTGFISADYVLEDINE